VEGAGGKARETVPRRRSSHTRSDAVPAAAWHGGDAGQGVERRGEAVWAGAGTLVQCSSPGARAAGSTPQHEHAARLAGRSSGGDGGSEGRCSAFFEEFC
jgi:hypothetical protein